MGLWIVSLCAAGLGGCRSGGDRLVEPGVVVAPVILESGQARVVRGDWNDVDAAVSVGLSDAEMAVLRVRVRSADRIEYELESILDEPGELIVTREPGTAALADGPGLPIRLEARVGRWLDETRAWRLLRGTARRLEDLAGVEFKPIE